MKTVFAFAALALTSHLVAAQTQPVPALPQAGNLLQNGNFESGSGSVTSGFRASAWSAVANWSQWANTGPVTSEWAAAPALDGAGAAHLQGQTSDGLFQFVGATTGNYTLSGWFKVSSGSAKLGLSWNGGSNVLYSTPVAAAGSWQYLSLTLDNVSGGSLGAVVYGASSGSDFYADGLWLNAGSSSTSPYSPANGFGVSPVPEPASAATLLVGLSALAFVARRRSRKL